MVSKLLNRLMRRGESNAIRLKPKRSASSVQSALKSRYRVEPIEPRILMSADPFSATLVDYDVTGATYVRLVEDSANNIRVEKSADNSSWSQVGSNATGNIRLTGSSGDDAISFSASNLANTNSTVVIDLGDGDDSVTFIDDYTSVGDLGIRSESVTVTDNATIDIGAGDLVVQAYSKDTSFASSGTNTEGGSDTSISIDNGSVVTANTISLSARSELEQTGGGAITVQATSSGLTSTIAQSATIDIRGSLTATTDISLTSLVDTNLDFTTSGDLSAAEIDLLIDQTSAVRVYGDAQITAKNLSIDADLDGLIRSGTAISDSSSFSASFEIDDASNGGNRVSAEVDLGADLNISGGTGAVNITADDTFSVAIENSGIAVASGGTKATVDVSRTTDASIGSNYVTASATAQTVALNKGQLIKDSAGNFYRYTSADSSGYSVSDSILATDVGDDFDVVSSGTLAGLISTNGAITVSAATSGDVELTVSSPFFGLAFNKIAQNTSALIAYAGITAASLKVRASDSSLYRSDARFSQNRLSGSTLASASHSVMSFSGKNSADHALDVSATDSIEQQARYNERLQTVSQGGVSSILPANADFVIAMNETTRDVRATVTEVDLTSSDADGDVRVEAIRSGAMDASINVTTASSNLSFGGVIAENRIGYEGGDLDSLSALGNLVSSIFYVPSSTPQVAEVSAILTGGTIDLGSNGALTVSALDQIDVNVTVSNVTLSADRTASWPSTSFGVSASALISQTLRSAAVEATIDDLDNSVSDSIDSVTVSAQDQADLYSNSLMLTEAVTPVDGGVSVISDELSAALATYISNEPAFDADSRGADESAFVAATARQ